MKFFRFTVLALILLAFVPHQAWAQLEYIKDGYTNKLLNQDEGPGAKIENTKTNKVKRKYIYERPHIKGLAHLYWAINLYNIEDDYAIDNFMKINECEIYQNFSNDDLEWRKVREATRVFLKNNKRDFPTRFEFTMPIMLKDYDTERRAFEIAKDYEIISSRRFEFRGFGNFDIPCVSTAALIAQSYPIGVVVEFSRPFTLTHVPVPRSDADQYIKRKKSQIKKEYAGKQKSLKNLKHVSYSYRRAYLIMKAKIFTHGKFVRARPGGGAVKSVQLMGVLEGYDIYEDLGRQRLLFGESYVTNKNAGKLALRLKEQYAILTEKSKGKGMLH